MNKKREEAFLTYFKEKGVEKQIRISPAKNVTPYNGFSYYKIEYKAEYPEALIKAYRQMNEINDVSPRKQFKRDRKNTKNSLLKIPMNASK